MQLGLGFCFVGCSTRVKVRNSLESLGLGFELAKTCNWDKGFVLLVLLKGLGLELVYKG